MSHFRHFLRGKMFEVGRTKFADYYQQALQEIIALGITPQQMEVLKRYGLLANDNVTGYYEGRTGDGRVATVKKAIEHVKQTGEQAYYVEMDLANLGGINAALGHTGANDIFAKIAQAIRTTLTPAASEAAFFRHGGDEMSAVLVDTTEQRIDQAMGHVGQVVNQLARQYNVHDIPHAKDKAGPFRGTGVTYGAARITPQHEQNPGMIFREADTKLEMRKKNVNRNAPVPTGPIAPQGQAGGTPQAAGANPQGY